MVACLPSKRPLESQLTGPAMEMDDRSMKGSTIVSRFELVPISLRSHCLLNTKTGDLALEKDRSLFALHPLHPTSPHPTARTRHAIASHRPCTKGPILEPKSNPGIRLDATSKDKPGRRFGHFAFSGTLVIRISSGLLEKPLGPCYLGGQIVLVQTPYQSWSAHSGFTPSNYPHTTNACHFRQYPLIFSRCRFPQEGTGSQT